MVHLPEVLRAEYNHLAGTIAPSIADFPKLQTLSLKHNEIEGSIPEDFRLHGFRKFSRAGGSDAKWNTDLMKFV